jgi:hypothetical protein
LGHALTLKAMHGGRAKHDRRAASQIAMLRRGVLPQAAVDPAAMRATRDLLRRRLHLMRKRAERRSPVQQTKSQEHLPEIGTHLADKAGGAGGL